MSRRNRKPAARPAQPAKTAPIARLPVPADMKRRSLQTALDMAPNDQRPLSLRDATKYRVEEDRYTPQERQAAEMAMDFSGESRSALSFTENTGFPGFPTLSLLGQLPEYRTMHETLADEAIRMWGRVVSSGASDQEECQAIEAELKRIDMRAVVRQAVVHDQAFGGAHVYFKLKGDEETRELPLLLKPYSVKKNSFEGLRVIEPYWVTPNFYNSIDPTAADFYKPSSWWMLGVQTHATRLQTLVSRPVADMLKPSYSFRGISMTQLAMPYVDNWLRTRQSVSDTVKQFSISGVRTDLQQALLPGAGADLAMRADLINRYRDNRNILFLDLATEEFFQVNTPLSGLDALQAQAQEQMSAVSHIPLIKLLGITPTGLNASSEGEIRVFYDYVRGYQSNVLMSLMQNTLKVIQLSLFGAIDEDISWEWAPLLELTALEAADARAKDADTDSKYVEMGAIRPDQVSARLAADPHSLYAGLGENETIDDIPDDDIGAITDKILEIGNEPPEGEGAESAGLPEGQAGNVEQELEEVEAEHAAGAHQSQMTQDPNPENDPGNLKRVDRDDDDLVGRPWQA